MLIKSLSISAFRGIRTSLELDLTARLTLIHAANGTGKTSVCDATEWLFTGEVQRLATALRDSPTGGVRNLFAEDRETGVRAQFSFNGSMLNVRRTGTGSAEKLELEAPPWRRLEQSKLMEQLAPSNLPAGSTRQQNLNRAAWFRAVRLLEATDLELLLDDTQVAHNIRGLLFSNLFGVSELQTREQALEKVRDAMMRPNRLEGEATRLRAEIREIEGTLNSAGERASEPFLVAARQHFDTAARFLGATVEGDTLPSQIGTMLESVRASQEEHLSRSRNAVATITRDWDRFQALTAELSAFEKQQAADAERLNQLRSQHETLSNLARESATVVMRNVRQEEPLRTLAPESLLLALNEALALWRNAAADPSTVVDTAALVAAERVTATQNEVLERQRAAITACAQHVPGWVDLVGKIKSAETRRAELELPTVDLVAVNDRALSDAQEHLRRIEVESERLAAPLQRLRSEGRRLLDSLPDEHQCPLCAHDHATPALLREAVDVGMQALPTALSLLGAQKTAQEAIAAKAVEHKQRWAAMTAEIAQINQVIVDARTKLTNAKDLLRATGIELPDINHPEFLQRFRDAEATFERKAAIARQNRSRVTELRVAGDSLASVRDSILAMAQALRAISPEEPEELKIAALPPSQWTEEVERLAIKLNAALQQAIQNTAATRIIADAHQQNLEILSGQINVISAALESRAARLSELRTAALPITAEWRTVAGEAPLTKEMLDTLPQFLAQSADRLAQSNVELRLAIENLNKAAEATEHERKVVANRSKLNELRGAVQRLERITKRRAELDRAVTLLREAKESFVNRQIQPLCSVITALYLRAQSNAFITAIGTDERGGAHRWTANADDTRLEAIAQLSQGQRQDFALAIFLARARDVRGTFFLDEPLLHLDDINRVALLDVLRVLVLETHPHPLRLVITTSSNSLVRHFREKFSLLPPNVHGPALRVYGLSGSPRAGVTVAEEQLMAR